jgi:hypothetical protein
MMMVMFMTKFVDIMDIKANLKSGRFAVKVNSLRNVLLEDTQTCEAIKIMQLPETFSHHDKGEWLPCFIYTSHSVNNPMAGKDGWCCSRCGWTTDERYDWCTCGSDMRQFRSISKDFEKLLEEL